VDHGQDHRARDQIKIPGCFLRNRVFLTVSQTAFPSLSVPDSIGSREDSRDFRVKRLRPCHDDDGGGGGGCTGLILAPRGNAIIEWFASRSARLRLPLSVEHASGKKPRVASGRSRGAQGDRISRSTRGRGEGAVPCTGRTLIEPGACSRIPE